MTDFDALYSALNGEIAALKDRFITKFIPTNPEHTPADFEHDVKAFSVLSHAAYEEFVETISEALLVKVEKDLLQMKTTLATACLLSSYGIKFQFSDSDDGDEETCFNRLRLAVEEAKRFHSKALKDNHGFSPKFMRKLLIPVGINMPSTSETASLKKLAEARGSFAHTMSKLARYGDYKRANKVLTPEEAWESARDCLKICETITEKAKLMA